MRFRALFYTDSLKSANGSQSLSRSRSQRETSYSPKAAGYKPALLAGVLVWRWAAITSTMTVRDSPTGEAVCDFANREFLCYNFLRLPGSHLQATRGASI